MMNNMSFLWRRTRRIKIGGSIGSTSSSRVVQLSSLSPSTFLSRDSLYHHSRYLPPPQLPETLSTTFAGTSVSSSSSKRWFSKTENGNESSISSSSSSSSDFDSQDNKNNKKLVMKYCRQENPFQAQLIYEQMMNVNEGGSDDIISDQLKTSIIDSWIKYQSKTIQKLKKREEATNEKSSSSSSVATKTKTLEDICYAAVCINGIIENMMSDDDDNDTTTTTTKSSSNISSSHLLVIALKGWANTCEIAYLLDLSKSDLVRGIPQRAQYLLSTTTNLSVEGYNEVIRAWAYSNEYLRGTMVDEMINTQIDVDKVNIETMKYAMLAWCTSQERRSPFIATGYFLRMMKMLEYDNQSLSYNDDDDNNNMKSLLINDYHMILEKWTTDVVDKNGPTKVKTILEVIEDAYQKGLTKDRADIKCYRDALITISSRYKNLHKNRIYPDIGELADGVLVEMKKRMIIPDTMCYGSAILAWRNVALTTTVLEDDEESTMMNNNENDDDDDDDALLSNSSSSSSQKREVAVKRALDLLREMTRAYHQTTTTTIKPTTENYNHVLECLSVSKNPKSIDHSRMLLDALEEGGGGGSMSSSSSSSSDKETSTTTTTTTQHDDNGGLSSSSSRPDYSITRYNDVGPTAKSYTHVLHVLRNHHSKSASSSSADNIQKQAVDLLLRMKNRLDDIRLYSKDKDIVETYSEFIRVCGSSKTNNGNNNNNNNNTRSSPTRIMTNCLKVLDELHNMNLRPDSNLYCALLETCDNLFVEAAGSEQRERILEKIFTIACKEGFVDRNMLRRFQSASSTWLYSKVVVAQSIDVDGIKCLPESWTRNASLRISIQGIPQGMLPLSIDGYRVRRKEEAQRRMRKVRNRNNQRMLQGGRI